MKFYSLLILMAIYDMQICFNLLLFVASMNVFFLAFLLYPPATFRVGARFGSSPIDGVWASPGISLHAVLILPVSSSPGNHCAFLLDLQLRDTIGEPRLRVARPPAR